MYRMWLASCQLCIPSTGVVLGGSRAKVGKLWPAGYSRPAGLLKPARGILTKLAKSYCDYDSFIWNCPVMTGIPLGGLFALFPSTTVTGADRYHSNIMSHPSGNRSLSFQAVASPMTALSVHTTTATSRDNPGSFACIQLNNSETKLLCTSQLCLKVLLCVK